MGEDKKVDKVKEAKKLLMEENKKKQDAFVKDYNEVCKKHKMHLQARGVFDIMFNK